MRVKMNEKILLCRKVAYDLRDKEQATLIFWTFGPEKYIVNCFRPEYAKVMFSNILEKGYVDVSMFEYHVVKTTS